ncbi:DUF2927 domain-containing protein [Acidimangrovimonas pyrenivorans]|uniref:DUF2927 domain-containing protein n=1 Tax=Acidimangrovimonas pyrenivorans TaxID=2030798 RepID=A0ABV7AJV1_9RHOB
MPLHRPFPGRVAALGLLTLTALAGCDALFVKPVPVPPPRPAGLRPAPSAASEAARVHYAKVQSDLLEQGLLRTDGGGPDTPFNTRDLTENFIRIALYDEYAPDGSGLVPKQTPSRLRRWNKPVRMSLTFGPTIPDEERAKDRKTVAAYAARLGRVSGHPVSLVSSGRTNFDIFVLNEDARRAFGPQLRKLVPGIGNNVVRTITTMPRSTYCLVFAFSEGNASTYSRAVAVIRGEHPDLLRLSCYHEELSQGLGLANDSPAARPSIFNDDEEFALLTTQDELMLKMLYDPRLKPGMKPAEARPIVRVIARELMGGQS